MPSANASRLHLSSSICWSSTKIWLGSRVVERYVGEPKAVLIGLLMLLFVEDEALRLWRLREIGLLLERGMAGDKSKYQCLRKDFSLEC